MARTSTIATTGPKTPAFQAWHVTNKATIASGPKSEQLGHAAMAKGFR